MNACPHQPGPVNDPTTEASWREYTTAIGAAKIRELRQAILFAMAEPAFLPSAYDEDTGEFAPVPNPGPAARARLLAIAATEHFAAGPLLAKWNWTERTCRADWTTMLGLLPPD